MEPILNCRDITCVRQHWRDGGTSSVAGITSEFEAGRLCGISGEDGCGKGLLLNLLGLLERPDRGQIRAVGQETGELDAGSITRLRNEAFGYLFSQVALLPGLTVAENVAIPLFRICGVDPREARERTLEVLEFCGCESLAELRAEDLDGDDAAGASLARALVHQPQILIAISPKSEERLLPLAVKAAEQLGTCVLWAGQPHRLSRCAHRLLELKQGKITADVDFT